MSLDLLKLFLLSHQRCDKFLSLRGFFQVLPAPLNMCLGDMGQKSV